MKLFERVTKISTLISIHLITLFVKETVGLYYLSKKKTGQNFVCNGFVDKT